MEIDNISILRLEAGSAEDVKNVVKEIVDKNTQRFVFNELNQDNKRKKIWSILFSHLERPSFSPCHNECLAAVRMLSRDKTDLDKLMTDKWVEILLHHAGLAPQEHNQHLALHNLEPEKYQTMIEALKALCNLVYNSEKVQLVCKQNKSVEEIVMRLRLFKEPDLPHEVKYFDMRMLFIITALCPETRERVKDELHGLTYLMETLDVIMNEATVGGNSTIVLNEDQVTLANEILKILFNLLAKHCTPHFDFEEDAHFLRLEIILKNLLLCKTEPKENLDNLHSHIINLLTTIPAACHKELITNVTSEDPLRGAEFDGKNMEAVSLLIDFLDKRLTGLSAPQNLKSEQDLISPIITVLIECARSEPILRRYLRMHILPPLRDVKTRPEEGDKLRNKLCRLLTSTVTNVRDLVAELLFVLCKENVTRMIKYTGYGNAAGMFANRGLLAHTRQNSNDFSSNSEDSDTEEYTQYRDRINPVVGCYEPPRPDPMASMTEEQKEYEAVKLVNMMDKLSRDGIVQPCRIGEDGRPQPVDHVLQLQEDLSKQKIYGHNDSADEDNN